MMRAVTRVSAHPPFAAICNNISIQVIQSERYYIIYYYYRAGREKFRQLSNCRHTAAKDSQRDI
eukprot:COSAG05_NODE_457_length_9624_cov_14.129554_7_plen_64_part_00